MLMYLLVLLLYQGLLTLYLYGNLDVSIIDTLPPGKEKKWNTYYIDKKERINFYLH